MLKQILKTNICRIYLSHIFRNSCSNASVNFNVAKQENIRTLLSLGASPQLFTVYGWSRMVQKQKRTSFIHLDDGSGERLQVVVSNELVDKNFKFHNGQALECTGRLVPSTGSKQSLELLCESIRVVGDCDPKTYTIGHLTSDFKLDYLRERIHLRPRVRYFQSVLRIRSELQNAIHIFMKQNDFLHVQTPMITANDCEGGGECFTLQPINWPKNNEKEYFGRPAFLTVSGQLHLEALASAMSRVYTIGPVFRAEKSMSPKHLSEFTMVEAEESFITNLDTLLSRVETLCKFLVYYIRSNCEEDWNYLLEQNRHNFADKMENTRFIRMTYTEALDLLESTDKYRDLRNHEQLPILNAQMERKLIELVDNVPLFITHYPLSQKPFYMKQDTDNKALCFDLLMPICGEVCGGSLREDNLNKLLNNIETKQMKDKNLEWYLDLRRFGHAPTGGFGLGFDRFVQTLTGIENIKDVVPFPRWPYHCYL